MSASKLKVFLSYSRENAEKSPQHFNKLLSCLEKLQKAGHFGELFVDRNIPVRDDWETAIERNLGQCELVVLAISNDFMKSEYCQHELRVAVDSDKAAPVLLDYANWWETDVRHLVIAPRDESGRLRPVSEFEDEKNAWERVHQELKEMFRCFDAERAFSESDLMRPSRFSTISPRMRKKLEGAMSFCLLARSGQGWWNDFEGLFDKVSEKPGESKILLLNPDSEAFEMTEPGWESFRWEPRNFEQYTQDAKRHIERIANKPLALRLIDAHVPYSLLIVNGTLKTLTRTTVFVELPKYTQAYRASRVVQIPPSQQKLFMDFHTMFETLWKRYASPRNIQLQDR